MDKYVPLRLENQLCFPLYAVSKEIVKRYKPYLDELGLTYTQYITMMVLWEHKETNVKELGQKLFLDSGTLTPVLKKLEQKGYLSRTRDADDERILKVSLTSQGDALREKAVKIPEYMGACFNIEKQEAKELYEILYKILNTSLKE